jgi:hypothetical protein
VRIGDEQNPTGGTANRPLLVLLMLMLLMLRVLLLVLIFVH